MPCPCGKAGRVKLSYTKITYCRKCFLRLLVKRAQKDLRQRKVFKPRDTICLLNDGSKEGYMAKWLLGQIFNDLVTIRDVKRFVKGKKVQPWSLDREIQEKIQPFLTGKTLKKDKTIRFPRNLLEEEIIAACKLLGYRKIRKDPPHELIDAMEARYPNTKFGLFRTFEKLES